MSRRDTIRAMQALEKEWDQENDIWIDAQEGTPVLDMRKDHEELKKDILGRGLLANMNFLEFIQFDEETEEPILKADDIEEQMLEMQFQWNSGAEFWEYFGDDHRADYGSLGHKTAGDDGFSTGFDNA